MVRTKPKKKSAAKRSRRRPPRRGSATRTTEAALAAFAHDIRTSLTGILALGELLASSNVGALTLQQQAFRPRRLIEALSDTLAARAETKGLTAEVTVAADLPEMLVGDAARLRAAIENLIDNAVKFTERGAIRLEVGATRVARGRVKLLVTVTDIGIGLTRAEIKRLFRPFAQANAEIARRYGGPGLGLAVVKSLAKLMDGDLTVTSTPGRGASFRFAVVLSIAAADTSGGTRAQQPMMPARRLAVLCAEDNPYGRVILNTILTELGHRADFVATGEEAVEAVKRGYDVVLMDVTLGGIDGLEATRRIRTLSGP